METMEPSVRPAARAATPSIADRECPQGDWSRAYSRCSLFGAALVGTEIFDSNICPHGPQGCLHVVRDATAQQNRETDYAQSGMTQRDVIYGGKDTLIAAFLETMGEYGQAGPKISISTCAPEIIGDNLRDVVSRINPNLPVVDVSGGFQGNQYYGLNETLRKLVMRFADPDPALEPGLVNLIGNIGGTLQWRADVREMDRLLSALGLRVNYLVCDGTLDNVRTASRAEATILITPEIGRPAAEHLQRAFGRAVIASPFGLPLGLRGTEFWLRAVADALALDTPRLDALLEQEEEETRLRLKVGLNNLVFAEKTQQLKRMPAAVVAEGVCALSWARFLAEELQVRPSVIGLRTPVRASGLHPDLTKWLDASPDCAVLTEPSVESMQAALGKSRPQLVLGSSLECEMVRALDLPAFVHVAHPNAQYVNIVEKPFLGYKGLLNVCELILNTI
jgi:nitrogenase molybdenum-iron protein alpha/beta subunit